MDKEGALKEFLAALRATLKSVIIYHARHAAAVKATEDLKQKIDKLLRWMNPVKIGFTPQGLRVEDRSLENHPLYRDIATVFHQRKIKSLEIRPGIDVQELLTFVAQFALSAKEIAHRGGPKHLLGEKGVDHIHIEELDYSQLLKDEGEELKDVWTYLLQDALTEGDDKKIDELAAHFDQVVTRFKLQEIVRTEGVRKNFSEFFAYLKKNDPEAYSRCATDLVRAVIRDKNIPSEADLIKVKSMVSDLPAKEFASLIHREFVDNLAFDALSFDLFSKLTEGDRENKISLHLAELFQKEITADSGPKMIDKIRRLLSGPETTFMSENYRKTLGLLLKSSEEEKTRHFDPRLLLRNYHFLLLNLLDKESQSESASALLELIHKEWTTIAEQKDFFYLRDLLETLGKKERLLSGEPLARQMENMAIQFVERSILEGAERPMLDAFIGALEKGSLDVNVYLKAIFTARQITPSLLRAFFKFHAGDIMYFDINLEQMASDSPFLNLLIENLEKVDSLLTLQILKSIFSRGGPEIKIRALQAMRYLSRCDEKFLFQLLKKGRFPLKREAFFVLAKFDPFRPRAHHALLGFPSPFGLHNRLLVENLGILRESNLIQAQKRVLLLSRRRFPWNKKLREAARRLLEEWDARKN